MSRFTYRMCWLILQLDRIPRYGRVYRLRPLPKKKEWRWMRHGMWGFYILIDLKLFWRFEAEARYRAILKERNK